MREEAGVTVGEVAAAIGASEFTVMRWELGETLPEGIRAADWARVVTSLGGQGRRTSGW